MVLKKWFVCDLFAYFKKNQYLCACILSVNYKIHEP